jgi:FkbM family methyltransferase
MTDPKILLSTFAMAYGRPPTAEELPLVKAAGAAATGTRDLLRRMIALIDGGIVPTPISVRFGPGDLTKVEVEGFQMLLTDSDYAVSRSIIEGKTYEPHMVSFIREHLRPGMTAVDIGANVGFFSMLFASIVGSNGRVLSFEPNTENCRLVLISAASNEFKNITLFPMALSKQRGHMLFTPAIGSNGTPLPSTAEALLDPKCIVVPCDTLDNLAPGRVDFIKIDVEGGEYLALSGAENILRRYRPIVTSEFCLGMLRQGSGIEGSDFLRWMQRLGYRVLLLGRHDARRCEVLDIDALMADWGKAERIEDVAFVSHASWPLPFDIPLSELRAVHGGNATPTADGLNLVTATAQWAYSLMGPLLPDPKFVSGPVVVKAKLRVIDGAIGILVAAVSDVSNSICEVIVSPSDDMQGVELQISEANDAETLILRNASARGVSRAVIRAIMVCRPDRFSQ